MYPRPALVDRPSTPPLDLSELATNAYEMTYHLLLCDLKLSSTQASGPTGVRILTDTISPSTSYFANLPSRDADVFSA
jgi:hypothetical protein